MKSGLVNSVSHKLGGLEGDTVYRVELVSAVCSIKAISCGPESKHDSFGGRVILRSCFHFQRGKIVREAISLNYNRREPVIEIVNIVVDSLYIYESGNVIVVKIKLPLETWPSSTPWYSDIIWSSELWNHWKNAPGKYGSGQKFQWT